MNAPFQGSDLFLAANLENEPSRCSFLRFQPLTGDHHRVPTFPHPSQARKQARFGLGPFSGHPSHPSTPKTSSKGSFSGLGPFFGPHHHHAPRTRSFFGVLTFCFNATGGTPPLLH